MPAITRGRSLGLPAGRMGRAHEHVVKSLDWSAATVFSRKTVRILASGVSFSSVHTGFAANRKRMQEGRKSFFEKFSTRKSRKTGRNPQILEWSLLLLVSACHR
jgi:lipid-binding SYLF domain-containing protein